MLPAAKYIKINEIRPFTSRNSPSGWESSWNAKDQILICFLNLKHFLCWVYHIRFLCFICLVFPSLKVKDLQLWSVIFVVVPFFLVMFWIQDPLFCTSPTGLRIVQGTKMTLVCPSCSRKCSGVCISVKTLCIWKPSYSWLGNALPSSSCLSYMSCYKLEGALTPQDSPWWTIGH